MLKLTRSFRIRQRGRPPLTDDSFASASAKCFLSHHKIQSNHFESLSSAQKAAPLHNVCTITSTTYPQIKNLSLFLPSFWMAHRSRRRPKLTLQYYCCCRPRRPTSPGHTQQLNSTFRSTAVQATFAGGEPSLTASGRRRRMAAECAPQPSNQTLRYAQCKSLLPAIQSSKPS